MPESIRTFRHFREVPESAWRWGNFSPAEIACRGTGQLKLHPEAMDKLPALRDRLGKPLIVRSAYRSPEHNRAVGGAKGSKHTDGTAFDIAMANHDPVAFEKAAREVGFLGIGYYPRSGFMHIDLGPARTWGEEFPARAVPFARELPPAREVWPKAGNCGAQGQQGLRPWARRLSMSRRNSSQRCRGAVLPLVPHLESLRWIFIALALSGISVAIWARVDDWRRGMR
ncbi:D-Ala-D-Ala carboxypeptidase family metallohydrolase [Tabrizicola sp.]|uniref:YcbK family protein n=1 Tax=Tabrizicola sp. TaxID=2005166 RepID=UPI0027352949|nr:D-Ala-D-Ala carboxypeptidase family metallohydrolase [Tabrizicola sp.]MDP3197177.1 D-Ala-D-Ala carboxypeptidase family metallohydrolase [Tabrizicola sp.]MDZ4067908.1 D-Ala-D-Ala carboxypeptidase family metallohydrolase [Tabrizicola sp.]